jgi:predicted ATP-grasp superfamily ATP-dependent carboligase
LPGDSQWQAVTRHAPTVLVQRRIRGPRYLVTVSYARGVERAACVHEKVVAAPYAFGPAAFGVTRRLDVLHDYAAKMFTALQWHGIADIEFRQDLADGRWYFMEINPRVCATLGIEVQAGLDLVGDWARVCAGHELDEAPGRRYRDGVRYAWGTRAVALMASRPWRMPLWGIGLLASEACDFDVMDTAMRRYAVRTGLWIARHS